MRNPFFSAARFAAFAAALTVLAMLPAGVSAQDDGGDMIASPTIPDKVTDLQGKKIDSDTYKNYVTTGRPMGDNNKIFLLYNVGTGKFLNTGSYFGLHAALGSVPRQFWLQRRNETTGTKHTSYKRYPDIDGEGPGTFVHDFFQLTTIQVGNTEGSKRANATYNYVRYVDIADGTWHDLIDGHTTFDGTQTFKKQIDDFSFDKYRIEAQINMAACKATQSGGGNMETLLSVGADVDKWSFDVPDVHIYGFRQGGKSFLRVQDLAADYKDATHKSGDDQNPIPVDDDLVTIVISKGHILINGVECMPRTSARTITNDPSKFFNLKGLRIGSHYLNGFGEDINATGPCSKAIYKNVAMVQGMYSDGKINESFEGNLTNMSVSADIDLSQCHDGVNENILSVGTDIANWGSADGQANIHIYYNHATKVLEVDGVDSNNKNGTKTQLTGIDGKVSIAVDSKGVAVNGATVLDADRSMVKTLAADATTSLQVGSAEGSSRSNAVYTNLAVTTGRGTSAVTTTLLSGTTIKHDKLLETIKHEDAPNTEEWSYGDDSTSLSGGKGITAEIDLSTCETTNENILSVGTEIDVWGSKENASNLHIVFLGKEKDGRCVVGVAFVDKDHDTDNKRAMMLDGSTMTLHLSQSGLFVNGVNVYPNIDPVPTVAYHDGLGGEVVRFKRYDGRVLFIDDNGQYIPLLPGDEGYDTAFGVEVQNTSYIYTDDNYSGADVPLFLSSRFNHESNKSTNEGVFLAWTPSNDYARWGTIGVYADRALPQTQGMTADKSLECSRWHFEPAQPVNTPAEKGHNLYRIYLEMSDTKVQVRNTSTWKEDSIVYNGTQRFYLQADNAYVYGNQLENYGGSYAEIDRSADPDGAEAECKDPETLANPDVALWKIIDVTEYNKLFEAANSEMTQMLDLTYWLRDPNFTRVDEELGQWSMDDGLTGKVRIGYDQMSKKSTTDKDYTDDNGKGDVYTVDKNGIKVYDNPYYKTAMDYRNNHARYMGVDVRNGGNGRFCQTVELTYPGWYSITCGGMSNVGAKLFVQHDKGGGNFSAPVEQPLYTLTSEEKEWFGQTGKKWPYDQFDKDTPMPFYNALVAINDTHAPGMAEGDKEGTLAARYQARVAFFIDPKVLADNGGSIKLRFGIDIPSETTTAEADQWTVFDNFHLLFGGRALEPNLVLDENSTNLDYLDNTLHLYDARPMHLNRTFSEGKWNTLILPVNLSKSDFHELFGNGARLAKLSSLTAKTIEFTSETENESNIYLHAFTPYIAWIPEGYGKGKREAYSAELANRADGGKTFTTVSVPEGHFYLQSATLEGKHTGDDEQSFYSFAADRTDSEGRPTYTYAADNIAENAADPTQDKLQAYGTLCTTYAKSEATGKNAIIDGRPTLGGCYILKDNDMSLIKTQYGTKGFRCWFGAPAGESNHTASGMRVLIDGIGDDATGIADIDADNASAAMFADGIYTASGIKVRSGNSVQGLAEGVYIVNGKKMVVRK